MHKKFNNSTARKDQKVKKLHQKVPQTVFFLWNNFPLNFANWIKELYEKNLIWNICHLI